MIRGMSLFVAVLTGALAGCDFQKGLQVCEDIGRCPASEEPSPPGGYCGGDGGSFLIGPLPYLSRENSPFPCDGAVEFFFDDFEDHGIDLPGLTVNAKLRDSGTAIDSVDADDGDIDGTCKKDGGVCQALYVSDAPVGITLTFDAGALPKFVGLVWTDGREFVRFEAFGADHESLGVFGPMSERGDGGFPDKVQNGQTPEDRFFGVVAPGGVSSVHISCGDGGMEIDHVQYGR
jgi:hypothetical protein